MLKHLMWALTAWACAASSVLAAGPVFEETTKDFGSVPRGTILTHQFKVTNTYDAPLHIAGTRTSCGLCSTAQIARNELQPGESTVVLVTVDTHKFGGNRNFSIFVLFDRPAVEEVRLVVQAVSREDISVEPGQLYFGRVKKGSGATASVRIEYHGGTQWHITGIENDNGYLQPQLQEASRGPGHVTYQLNVKLRDDTPIGCWHSEVLLKTSDASTPRIRVPLTVEIEGALGVTPSEVVFGRIKPGARAERRVVIRGSTPFKIVRLEGADETIQVNYKADESRPVQVLTVVCQAGDIPLELTRKLRVITDLPAEDGTVEFTVQAQVGP
jgi:hypothetical protein